ncbi:ribonuclease HIII [Methanosphaera sp. ISO3-F5]|uniref:ribonuclease HIII n=1 Tax=Methanosphaera sp. ISO3-F5 TaxID=1452353 RepID=UPI002B260CE3|nr:ribonuclease HIII [Methanosphaera sp. ISO3-F5]WQH63390.1 ribonuclease HIII [Methanosphaera sp. ISO3-F5]
MKSVSLSDLEVGRFLSLCGDLRHESPHQYERVRIKDGDLFFVLYNSNKLVFNENGASFSFLDDVLEKREYVEPVVRDNNIEDRSNYSISMLDNYDFTIGSDETGKGEWYGPLVITAVSTSHDENIKLKRIGVTDSKKLSRKQIINQYKKIEKLGINHETLILTPFSYNKLYNKFKSEGKNLNHLLAYLHSKAITNLLKQVNTTNVLIIIDKFDYKKMNDYLDVDDKIKVIQESDGERFIPVATSSIIAKYHYEKTLKEIEERYNISLRKTKPKNIDKNILDKVAKTHFKNVKPYIKQ